MASVGRQLCHQLVDAASDLRRYAALVDEFPDPDNVLLIADCLSIAGRLEVLIPLVLAFEGERLPQLTVGQAARAASE